MINGSDWSQFIPDLIVALLALLVASVGARISYRKSPKFCEWFKQMRNRLVHLGVSFPTVGRGSFTHKTLSGNQRLIYAQVY